MNQVTRFFGTEILDIKNPIFYQDIKEAADSLAAKVDDGSVNAFIKNEDVLYRVRYFRALFKRFAEIVNIPLEGESGSDFLKKLSRKMIKKEHLEVKATGEVIAEIARKIALIKPRLYPLSLCYPDEEGKDVKFQIEPKPLASIPIVQGIIAYYLFSFEYLKDDVITFLKRIQDTGDLDPNSSEEQKFVAYELRTLADTFQIDLRSRDFLAQLLKKMEGVEPYSHCLRIISPVIKKIIGALQRERRNEKCLSEPASINTTLREAKEIKKPDVVINEEPVITSETELAYSIFPVLPRPRRSNSGKIALAKHNEKVNQWVRDNVERKRQAEIERQIAEAEQLVQIPTLIGSNVEANTNKLLDGELNEEMLTSKMAEQITVKEVQEGLGVDDSEPELNFGVTESLEAVGNPDPLMEIEAAVGDEIEEVLEIGKMNGDILRQRLRRFFTTLGLERRSIYPDRFFNYEESDPEKLADKVHIIFEKLLQRQPVFRFRDIMIERIRHQNMVIKYKTPLRKNSSMNPKDDERKRQLRVSDITLLPFWSHLDLDKRKELAQRTTAYILHKKTSYFEAQNIYLLLENIYLAIHSLTEKYAREGLSSDWIGLAHKAAPEVLDLWVSGKRLEAELRALRIFTDIKKEEDRREAHLKLSPAQRLQLREKAHLAEIKKGERLVMTPICLAMGQCMPGLCDGGCTPKIA